MTKLHKILFISAPVGAGHIRAANAIRTALCKDNEQIETKIANVFDFFNPFIGRMILRIYLKVLKVFPGLYGMAYSWGNESTFALAGRKVISGYLAGKMEKYITDYNPAMIVCTHATPAGLVAHLIKKNRLQIPVLAVVTDFVVHRLWIYPEIQHYTVANEQMREFLMNYGKEKNVEVMGIPVDEKFVMAIDKERIINELQFNSHTKTILVIGGGTGILPMDDIVMCCEKIDIPLQIIVVTGNNKSIYHKLLALQPDLRNKVKVLGYVDNVNELMSVADLIISKPGGMTVAEALCQGVPMLIYRPIPGQEEANTNYLLTCKAALRADSLSDIQMIIRRLFIEEPETWTTLQQNMLGIGQPLAAPRIAQYIYSQVCDL